MKRLNLMFSILFFSSALFAVEAVPYVLNNPSVPAEGGSINGSVADVIDLNTQKIYIVATDVKAANFDAAVEVCANFKAGDAQWSLPTFETFYLLYVASQGVSKTLQPSEDAKGGFNIWSTSLTPEVLVRLQGTKTILSVDSQLQGGFAFLDAIEKLYKDLLAKDPTNTRVQAALAEIESGYPVMCVSENPKN